MPGSTVNVTPDGTVRVQSIRYASRKSGLQVVSAVSGCAHMELLLSRVRVVRVTGLVVLLPVMSRVKTA